MAKTLNILKGGNAPYADGGLKLSKKILLEKVEEHPKFRELFGIDETLLERIVESLLHNGFDESQPIHIWVTEEEGVTHRYLIDGYTRKLAAEKAHERCKDKNKFISIPCYEHHFDDFEQAYKYALSLQVNRRNLESSELLKNVSELMGTEYIQNIGGSKSEAIADALGVSTRTVERAISVAKNASEEIKDKVESGEMSVNQAYKVLHPKDNRHVTDGSEPDPQASDLDAFDDISESLSDTSGDPKGIVIGDHSDHIERPDNRLSAEEDSERTRERKNAYDLGFVDGFLRAAEYVLCQKLKGATAKNIYKAIFCSQTPTKEFLETLLPDEKGAGYYRSLRREISLDGKTTDFNPAVLESDNTTQNGDDSGITPDIEIEGD